MCPAPPPRCARSPSPSAPRTGRIIEGELRDPALFDVQDADQGEEASGGVEVHLDLVLQAVLEELGSLVVDAAPGHVDRLDALGRVRADGFEIAFADREIVLEGALEAAEGQ